MCTLVENTTHHTEPQTTMADHKADDNLRNITAKNFTTKSGLRVRGGGGLKPDLVPAFLLFFPQRKGVQESKFTVHRPREPLNMIWCHFGFSRGTLKGD